MCSEDEDKSVRSFATYAIICSFFLIGGSVVNCGWRKIAGCSNSVTQQWLNAARASISQYFVLIRRNKSDFSNFAMQ